MGIDGAAGPGWRETNRARWEEMASVHPHTELYDLDGVVAGRDDIRPWDEAELGPVAGLDLLHLQCHIGTDTVGWARRGANVVGVDFSATVLDVARLLGRRCGLEVGWLERGPDRWHRFPGGALRFPVTYPLRARRPSAGSK